jgi:hypothetical protein
MIGGVAMSIRPKVSADCEALARAEVERALVKHFGHIPGAARELGVAATDLWRLTWAEPSLYNNAMDELELIVLRAQGAVITALYSDDPRRQEWASDKIMRSYAARDHPLARRPAVVALSAGRPI